MIVVVFVRDELKPERLNCNYRIIIIVIIIYISKIEITQTTAPTHTIEHKHLCFILAPLLCRLYYDSSNWCN